MVPHTVPEPSRAHLKPTPISSLATVPENGKVAIGNDVPVIARSCAYDDLAPFIRFLWLNRTDVCLDLFTDQFPRHEDGTPSSKEEEDSFLSNKVGAETLHVHGGAFLKQALYAVALYNDSQVTKFADNWAKQHREWFMDRSMLMGMCGDVAEPRNFFTAEEAAGHDQCFLRRVIFKLRYGLQALQIAQTSSKVTQSERLAIERPDETAMTNKQVLVGARTNDDSTAAQPWTSSSDAGGEQATPAVLVPVTFPDASKTPHTEPARSTPPSMHSDLALGRAGNTNNSVHDDRLVTDSLVPHPGTRLRSGGGATSENRPPGRMAHPSPFLGLHDTITIQQGPHTSPLPYGTSNFNSQPSPQFYVGTPQGFHSPGFSPTHVPTWAGNNGSAIQHGRVPEHYYHGNGSRQVQSIVQDCSPFHDRPTRGSAQPNLMRMDPDSFTRLPGDKPKSAPYMQESRRSNDYRNSSWQSSEEHFVPRDASYEQQLAIQRRVYSDQSRGSQPISFEPSTGMPHAPFTLPQNHRGSLSSRRGSFGHHGPKPSGHFSDHRPPQAIEILETYIPPDRNDLRALVLSHVPQQISLQDMYLGLSEYANITRVSPAHSKFYQGQGDQASPTWFVYFDNTDEARKVVARNDIIIKGYPAFLKVPRKYYSQEFVPQMHYSKPRGIAPQAPNAWSSEKARVPSNSDYPPAQLHGFGPMQAFGSEPPLHGGFHGNNFQVYPPSLGGIPPRGGHADLSDGPPLVSESSTPGKKKSSKKKSKNRKFSEPMHPKAMVHQASSTTVPVRTTIDGFSNSDQVDPSSDTMIFRSTNMPQTLRYAYRTTGEVNNVFLYAQGIQTSTISAQPATKMTSYATVAETARGHGLDKPKDTQQPELLPVLQKYSEAETNEPVIDGSSSRTHGTVSLDKSPHCSGKAESARVGEKTPPRPVDHGSEKEVTPPRSGEDADESFQTAVETPESARSTLVAEPGLKSDEQDQCAHAEQIAESAVCGSDSSHSAKIGLVGPESHVSDVELNEGTTGSRDSKPGPGPSGGIVASLPASKVCEAIKSGPSKTESLSPFARPVQQPRKSKKKLQKKDRKNASSDTSGGKDHSRTVSSMSADDDVLSSSTTEDTVLLQSRPMPATDSQDTKLVQSVQAAPAKSLLNRLLFGGRQKNEDSAATKLVADQSSVLDSVAIHMSGSGTTSGDSSSHVEPTLIDGGTAAAESCINVAQEMYDILPVGIDPLSISKSILPSDSGAECQQAPTQEASLEVADPMETIKKQKKKKKKSNKRKGATSQAVHTDQPISAVHEEDASSTATMQAHTPEGSRSASVEPQMYHTQGWKGVDLSNLPESYGKFERNHSVADGVQRSSESWLSSSSTEQCLTVLNSMVTENVESNSNIAPDDLVNNQGDVQRSMHKIKQLDHEERVRRLTAKSDLKGVEAEETKWAKYLDECQINQST